jgi:hypothetical protein
MNAPLPMSLRLAHLFGSAINGASLSNPKEERLPFTVRLVQNDEDLLKAVDIRHSAYARHMPVFAESLLQPEGLDTTEGVFVLLAESKLDGSPLGTCRIQTNRYQPLGVEQSVTLPPSFEGQSLAEVTRLGVAQGGAGRLVKMALIKAAFMVCEREGIDWAIVAGRAPIDRQYEQLLFADLFPETGFIPMQHAGNVPHRVMGFEIASGNERWTAANHPLLGFFSLTRHSDIQVDKVYPTADEAQMDGNQLHAHISPAPSNKHEGNIAR